MRKLTPCYSDSQVYQHAKHSHLPKINHSTNKQNSFYQFIATLTLNSCHVRWVWHGLTTRDVSKNFKSDVILKGNHKLVFNSFLNE